MDNIWIGKFTEHFIVEVLIRTEFELSVSMCY